MNRAMIKRASDLKHLHKCSAMAQSKFHSDDELRYKFNGQSNFDLRKVFIVGSRMLNCESH